MFIQTVEKLSDTKNLTVNKSYRTLYSDLKTNYTNFDGCLSA